MANDNEFFDSDSPLGGRQRRESLEDALGSLEDQAHWLSDAIRDNDLEKARECFAEIKGWVDALDDDLCERNMDGSRREVG